jgi:hypothetical protein
MFIYLIKKIAIPNGIKLQSLAWNPDQVSSAYVVLGYKTVMCATGYSAESLGNTYGG